MSIGTYTAYKFLSAPEIKRITVWGRCFEESQKHLKAS